MGKRKRTIVPSEATLQIQKEDEKKKETSIKLPDKLDSIGTYSKPATTLAGLSSVIDRRMIFLHPWIVNPALAPMQFRPDCEKKYKELSSLLKKFHGKIYPSFGVLAWEIQTSLD